MLLSMGFAAVMSIASGCASTIAEKLDQTAPFELSNIIPPFKLDSSASSMVIYDGNDSPTEADADQVRLALARLLATPRYQRGGVIPARFRVSVKVDHKWWPAIACIDLQILGCPTGYTNANVILELQVGDMFFIGRGQATGSADFITTV